MALPNDSLARNPMLLLSGTANRPLAEKVGSELGEQLCKATIRRFADGEIFVKIDENVRGRDVYIIQPTNPPAENLIELLLLKEGRVVTKQQITEHLYGWEEGSTSNAVEVFIYRLRRKLEPSGVDIRTVRGMGYLIDKPHAA